MQLRHIHNLDGHVFTGGSCLDGGQRELRTLLPFVSFVHENKIALNYFYFSAEWHDISVKQILVVDSVTEAFYR